MNNRIYNSTFVLLIACLMSATGLLANNDLRTGTISEADSLELVNLWNMTDGPNWSPTTWDLTQPISTWGGITLNDDGSEIIEIKINSNNLEGTIPNFDLPNLEELNLFNNDLTGPIPNFNLPNLTSLNLTWNNFSATLPNFDNLQNLVYLAITSSQLYGSIPDFGLPNLEAISLQGNQLTGSIPNFDLPNLETLNLKGNQLSGSFPNLNLPNLSFVDASENQISGAIPSLDLPELKFLYLYENEIVGPLVDFNLPELINLDLGYNQIIGSLPLWDFPNIEELDIGNNLLTGPLPLWDFPSVNIIILTYNEITGPIPNFDLPNLENLLLRYNQLSGSLPDFVLPSIESLSLDFNQLSGDLPNWDMPNLYTLYLNNNLLTGEIPNYSGLPSMLNFNLSDNDLTGPIPNFDLMTSVSGMYLRNNELTGPIPSFENLENLSNLDLKNNNLSGPIPELDYLLPLSSFKVSGNNLIGCFPLWLCDVGNVETSNNPGLPAGGSSSVFDNFCMNPATQLGQTCDDGDPTTTGEVIQPDCSCSTVNSFTNFIKGKLFMDTMENCVYDIGETPLSQWLITASNNDNTYYAMADIQGDYTLYTDTGSYTMGVVVPNDYWGLCPGIQGYPIDFPVLDDSVLLDIPAIVNVSCPLMITDIGTSSLIRCFDTNYSLTYSNEGTAIGENAYIEVNFEENLNINFSNPPWTSQNGQTLIYDLGNVGVYDFGTITINVTVDCDSTQLGEVLCASAHIYPDSICFSNTLWDGSTTQVDGKCEVDSVTFYIENIGDNNMSEQLGYIIIEDHLILKSGSFMLPTGGVDSVSVHTDGSTFRIEAEQAAYHPTQSMPGLSIEGCSNGPSPDSTGYVNMFLQDDSDPFISIECREVVGAFDPNDKHAFPTGLGVNHLITEFTELEYLIRFQNTGTDTAHTVVIKDEISEFLNPSSIRMGAYSHPYTWEILPGDILALTFENIMLPDSNVNEVASHGFFKFKINQIPGNQPGTIINNEAAIFFDFNAPVITNMTEHMIEDKLIVYDTTYTLYCDHWLYENDTIINVFSEFEYYDLYLTHFIEISEGSTTTIDTLLQNGVSYDGIFYDNDTTLLLTYVNTQNCDSIVFVNISVLTNVDENGIKQQLRLSPNPAKEEVYLLMNIQERYTIENIIINNQLGQTVYTIPIDREYSQGEQVVNIPLNSLSSGLYYVSVNGVDFKWTEKLMIYR